MCRSASMTACCIEVLQTFVKSAASSLLEPLIKRALLQYQVLALGRVAVPGHASLLEQVGAYYAWRSAGAGCKRNPPTHPFPHLCKWHRRLRLAGWMQLLSKVCTNWSSNQ